MIINNILRKKVKALLPKNYRKVIVARLAKRHLVVHPNTIYNVLHGDHNPEVANEILILASEQLKLRKQFNENRKLLLKS